MPARATPHDSWKTSAPSIEDISYGATVIRRAGKCAILLPVLDEREMLARHISELSMQSTAEFTLIVVSPEIKASELKDTGRFGIIHIAERGRNGLAAASYCGERYAVDSGFEVIIHADVGCSGLSPRLIEKLYSSAMENRKAIFFPSKANAGGNSAVLDWYGAAHRSLHLESGYTYIPFYFGCQELEMRIRMEQTGAALKTLDGVSVEHTFSPAEWKDSGRVLYSLRNQGIKPFEMPGFLPNAAYSLSSLAFFDSKASFLPRIGASFELLREMVLLRMFRCEAFHGFKTRIWKSVDISSIAGKEGGAAAISVGRVVNRESHMKAVRELESFGVPLMRLEGDGLQFLLRMYLAIAIRSISGKSVVLLARPLLAMNPFSLLARNLYCVGHDGKAIAILEGRSLAARAGSFLLSIAALSLLLPSYILLSIMAWLRIGRHTWRYGVGGGK